MKISLYYKQGSSDKEYHVQLAPQGSGWVVNFQYGRRGSSLTAGTKTQQPVSQTEARKIFDKLVAEKQAKGYTAGEAGTPYAGAPASLQVSGVVPQLLNPIAEEEAERFIQDDGWCAQEKYDGRNRLLRSNPPMVEGINKLGLVVGIPQPLADTGLRMGRCLLAGEEVGGKLYAFDLLERAGEDLRAWPYQQRYQALMSLLAACPGQHGNVIAVAPTAWNMPQKRKLLADLKQANAEGMVFKKVAAPYTAGRPNSSGDQLKVKFYATLSAIVDGVNDKRSVRLALLDGSGTRGTGIVVGNVTIPPNWPMPQTGDVVEVRYLYAFPGGSLFQPTYLGPRDDVEPAECRITQLKFKRDEDDQ